MQGRARSGFSRRPNAPTATTARPPDGNAGVGNPGRRLQRTRGEEQNASAVRASTDALAMESRSSLPATTVSTSR